MKIIKKGFNYSQDGPGNRLIFHLQGCNMNCPWCSNPEGMDRDGCIITENDGFQKMSYCKYSIEELLEEVIECKHLFFDGGGVTLSGGEPTLQFDELKEFLEKLHNSGIHTVIETNGSHKRIEELFPFLNLMIIDLKHIDEEIHKKWIGISNKITIETIRKGIRKDQDMLIRTPLIRGFNDQKECAQRFVEFYRNFNTERVNFELLIYHEYGKSKWKQCGKEYQMVNGFVDESVREYYEELYRKNGLHVIRT